MIAIFIKHYALFLVVLSAFFIVGRLALTVLGSRFGTWSKPLQVFASILLGTVLVSLGYATVHTGASTILLGIVPILGLLWYRSKNAGIEVGTTESSSISIGWSAVALYTALVGLVLFSFFFSEVYADQFPTKFIPPKGNDYAFYVNLSEGLTLSGLENNQIPQTHLDGQPQVTKPYHYFDFWLTGLIAKLTGQLNLVVYTLYILPLFLLLSCMGLWVVALRYGLGRWSIPFSVLLVGFGSVHFSVYNNIAYLSREFYQLHHLGGNVLYFYKLINVIPFLLGAMLLVANGRFASALIVLSVLPIIYGSFLPAVFGISMVFIAIAFKWKQVSRSELLQCLAAIGFTVIFYSGFYLLFGDTAGVKPKGGLELLSIAALKTRINIMGLTTIQSGVLYFPILGVVALLYLLNRKLYASYAKQQLVYLLYIVVAYILGLLGWSVLYRSNDAIQIFSNITVLANMVWAVLVLSIIGPIIYEKVNKWYNILLMAALILIIVSQVAINIQGDLAGKNTLAETYSEEYINAISGQFTDEASLVGVYLKGDAEYLHPKYKPAHRNSLAFSSLWYLSSMPQYFSTLHLSALDFELSQDPLERSREEVSRSRNIFNIFVEKQKKDGNYSTLAESKLQFVKHYNIKYLVATASAEVPSSLLSAIDTCFVDRNTGEQFCVLNTTD